MVFMEFNALFENVLRLPISQSVGKLIDDISECLQSLSSALSSLNAANRSPTLTPFSCAKPALTSNTYWAGSLEG